MTALRFIRDFVLTILWVAGAAALYFTPFVLVGLGLILDSEGYTIIGPCIALFGIVFPIGFLGAVCSTEKENAAS